MRVTKCLYCQRIPLEKVTHRSDGVDIIRCTHCRVMMVAEINDNTEDLYTKEYFEKAEGTPQGYTTYMSSPTVNLYGKYGFAALFSRGTRHLDLGSADGSLMEIFQHNGYKTTGLEISKDAVEATTKKGLIAHQSNLHNFPDGLDKIDVITAYDLLEHADRPDLVLKNTYDTLADDGVFVFSTLSVTKYDVTDYWFNNSLEHYIYYDNESLTNILTEVFGKGKFGFVEEVINGVSEFWGFATKGDAKHHQAIIQIMRKSLVPEDVEDAYYLSLFYNQVSQFKESAEIITQYQSRWSEERQTVAVFLNNYIQGHLERALDLTKNAVMTVPSTNGIFWRGYYQAEHDLSQIRRGDAARIYDAEIISQKEQVFRLQEEIRSLRNSRVVGRIIKARDIVTGSLLPGAKTLARHTARGMIHHTKRVIGAPMPMEMKIKLGRRKRQVLSWIRGEAPLTTTDRYIDNIEWCEGPILSVVIPYYNRGNTIDDTMASLTKQTFTDFEVIIVNDGSTEAESIKKFDGLASKYKRLDLCLVHQKNSGVARARNNGIKKARGKYIICLDSDDLIVPTYIEKMLITLETDPDISIVTSYRKDFGARNEVYIAANYDPMTLIKDNMVTTAAAFRKEAWERSRGYLDDIGYEDWEYWLQLAENGDWGKTLREPLFLYRVAHQSRFADDKSKHWKNISVIRALHKNYKKVVQNLRKERQRSITHVNPTTALINLNKPSSYAQPDQRKTKILIVIPWMTFGGAETLLYNFCRPLQEAYDITFVTGEESNHEWEYKFREITDKIFHLPQLLKDRDLFGEFVSNYITVHGIQIVHIVHSGYIFDDLPKIKRDNPQVKVAVTMFNDRVDEYVKKSVEYKEHIDSFNTDSQRVAESFREKFNNLPSPTVIPNGIDCYGDFSPHLFDREKIRKSLSLEDDDIAVGFFGRLSPEKNPDIFIKVAQELKANKGLKFFLIGDGPMRDECSQLIQSSNGIAVKMLGYQSNVAEYLSGFDVFVLPSSIEGFPLSLLEAYAMALPVVASDVGAIPDVLASGVNGYVISPGSVSEIVVALENLGDKKLRKKMGTNNRREAEEKYSIEQLGARYNDMYRRTLG